MVDPTHEPSRLESFVTLIGSLAWPIVVSAVLILYRGELREFVAILIQRLRSGDDVNIGGVAIARKAIASAISAIPVTPSDKAVPKVQVENARKLEEAVESAGVAPAKSAELVRDRIDHLATLYETTRDSMPKSDERTEALDHITAQMRTLALLARPLLSELVISTRPGERLAAIAILQVHPDPSYLNWLAERMSVEFPFIFFHASLALRELAVEGAIPDLAEMRHQVERALDTVSSYRDGPPDANTISVLNDTLEILSNI